MIKLAATATKNIDEGANNPSADTCKAIATITATMASA